MMAVGDNDHLWNTSDLFLSLSSLVSLMSSARKPEDMTDKELKEGIVAMEADIGGCEEAERVRKEYINKLEEYNYFKDIGQMLIGRIADRTGKTMKDVYKDLDIEDD
ncbi:hypothetical protein E3P84_03323 [Wallemia ichthyophaga]|nr:hypothetical protein E3P84_03323 [Wallemia ichthyophaga]TIB44099.1 hypothetical protein E3P83_00424 [Wallemia ichthyophaga]